MRTLNKLRSLPSADRRLLVEAVAWLAVARLMIAIMPFQRIVHHLGLAKINKPVELVDAPAGPDVERVGWAVRVVAGRVPRIGSCLTQAIAGSLLLTRRGIENTVCLGVAKDDSEGIAAHAWLIADDAVLTGRSGAERYQPISSFVCRPLRPRERSADEGLSPRQSAAQALLLQSELIRVLDAFDSADIETVVFKGVPLAIVAYGDVGGRSFGDNDVLVHRRDAERAFEVARSLGYEPALIPLETALRRTNQVRLRRDSPIGAADLEIHWSPLIMTLFPVPEEYIWSRTEAFDRGGLLCRVFEPHLCLVYLAHHYAVHRFEWEKTLRDIAALWNAQRDRIDPCELVAVARATGLSGALSIAITHANELGLFSAEPPAVRSRRAAVLLRALEGRLGATSHGRSVLFLALARPDRAIRALGRFAAPPTAEMALVYSDEGSLTRRIARPLELAIGSLAGTLSSPKRGALRDKTT